MKRGFYFRAYNNINKKTLVISTIGTLCLKMNVNKLSAVDVVTHVTHASLLIFSATNGVDGVLQEMQPN